MTSESPLQLGDEVLIVFEQSGGRQPVVASVTAISPEMVTVTFPTQSLFPAGPPVSVLAASGDFSQYAPVTRAARRGSEMALNHGNWRRILDRRASTRYPVLFECELVSGALRVEGRCVDLTDRGAAVEVSQWSGGAFDLEFGGLVIPCRVASIESLAMMDIIHATFVEPSAETTGIIRTIVELARIEFTASQRQLASGMPRTPDWARMA